MSPDDPRIDEVEGDTGFPGELVESEHNQPGSQAPPPDAEPTETPVSDMKGTSGS